MKKLRRKISESTYNHKLEDIDQVKTKATCKLSSNIEYLFVNLLCNYLYQNIPNFRKCKFNQLFYVPNLRAEKLVGYDLSIGFFNNPNRILTMNKVIKRYCDEQWSFLLSERDINHIKKLLDFNNKSVKPYFVLNICYCIHDYRRMGEEFDDIINPPFDSISRTIVIDLKKLGCEITNNINYIDNENWKLKINRSFSINSNKEFDVFTGVQIFYNGSWIALDSDKLILPLEQFRMITDDHCKITI